MKAENQSISTKKELLYLLKFSKEDVINNEPEKKIRSFQLIRAMQLGNLFKNKVTICFKDAQNRLMNINTTIWGVTKETVILKKGVYLPINSIISVD